uniref:Uncharacterized protein n=1 Tax=Chlamydomonas euryale TaxID=1486919 RepID=A0A7R9VI82_9CHLO|mmetsp:Transcript_3576/g.9991  ORF Transcript_3576/g.9991 Transcript_3576/m.9991 type:complete len:434 (+) Transcript_3576:1-1302(+)
MLLRGMTSSRAAAAATSLLVRRGQAAAGGAAADGVMHRRLFSCRQHGTIAGSMGLSPAGPLTSGALAARSRGGRHLPAAAAARSSSTNKSSCSCSSSSCVGSASAHCSMSGMSYFGCVSSAEPLGRRRPIEPWQLRGYCSHGSSKSACQAGTSSTSSSTSSSSRSGQHEMCFAGAPHAGAAAMQLLHGVAPGAGRPRTVARPRVRARSTGNPHVSAPAERLRVAIDIDEVLGRFLYQLNIYYLERFGREYSTDDFWVYEFAKVWNCSQDESNKIVYDFFQHPLFKEKGIPVIPGAFESLKRLGESFDLVVVTSRQHAIQDVTLDWIDRNYPGIFQEVYFGNHWALEGSATKKSDICRAIGASVIVDDNVGYAVDCASNGVQVLLYDWQHQYPWSKLPADKAHPLIRVVSSWSEVENALHAMAPALTAELNNAA